MSDIQLDNKVALITGAAGGFGRTLARARAFLTAGAKVSLLDINQPGLAAPAEDLHNAGFAGQYFTQSIDIADHQIWHRARYGLVQNLTTDQ